MSESDVATGPAPESDLTDAAEASDADAPADRGSDGTVLAVAGAKGGVGKTTTALNLAAAYGERGVSAVVVELDLAMANFLDVLDLDLEAQPTMHDVLAGDADVTETLRAAPGGFDVAPSGISLEQFAETDLDELPAAIDALRDDYQIVVLDTGAGASRETITPLRLADQVLLVATPEDAALRDAAKTQALTHKVDGSVAGLVLTRSGREVSPGLDTVSQSLGDDLLGYVPEDDAVPAAQGADEPVVRHRPGSRAGEAYQSIAGQVAAEIAPSLAAGLNTPTAPGPSSAPGAGRAATDGGRPRGTADADGSSDTRGLIGRFLGLFGF